MRTYEAVFILDTRGLEDGGDAFVQDAAKHVRSLGGEVTKRTSMGRKHFAHPIKKQRAGLYWDLILDLDPAKVAALEDRYKLNNTVLRLQVVLYEEPPRVPPRSNSDRDSGRDRN